MASYTLHLGFNWDSPLIGALFAASALDARFLQFELQDDSGNPASFARLQVDDIVWFQLHCLTGPTNGEGFAAPDLLIVLMPVIQLGNTIAACEPASLVQFSNEEYVRDIDVEGQPVVQFLLSYGQPGGNSPWGQVQYTWTFDSSMQLIQDSTFELGFWLSLQTGSGAGADCRTFAADPEVIVGSGSSPS